MTIVSLLHERRLGFPRAKKLREKMECNAGYNITRDIFKNATIPLVNFPKHCISRCREFVVVMGMEIGRIKTAQLALWHLPTNHKIWEIDIDLPLRDSKVFNCRVSKAGMVLVTDEYDQAPPILFWKGKKYPGLPKMPWTSSIILIGNRILCTWKEYNSPEFLGEWTPKRKCLYRHRLDEHKARIVHHALCDENYWVRLSESKHSSTPPLIEVIHRSNGSLTAFELPTSVDEVQFTTSCISHDQLFFGTIVVREEQIIDNSLWIFDLSHGMLVHEFRIGSVNTELKCLNANSEYLAWLEYQGSPTPSDPVRYLNLATQKIEEAALVPTHHKGEQLQIHITGSCLSIIFGDHDPIALWRRLAIDMTTNSLVQNVSHKRSTGSQCTLYKECLLVTEVERLGFDPSANLYIENYQS